MLDRAEQFVPGISKARIISEFTGLRPGRTKIRVEEEKVTAGSKQLPVIHNYGHGGSGATLSWGCAKEVAELATKYQTTQQPRAKL
jgi:glycine/D-amino acid oxidase-like deaminating enzyme